MGPALLTLGAAGWRLGTPSLWADELATWGAVRLGWGQLFRLSGHVDAVVAPYYVLAKVWAAVAGTSPVALRLPSALAMAAATALVAVLGARVADRRGGVAGRGLVSGPPGPPRVAPEGGPHRVVV